MITLNGRTALITGAANGIGAAIARAYAAAGATLLLFDRDAGTLATLAASLAETGAPCSSFVCDVTNALEITECVRVAVGRHGAVDILVNNAGGSGPTPALDVETIDESVWRHVMDLNLTSSFHFASLIVPTMRAKGFGRIINMSSTLRDGVAGPLNTVNARLPYVTAKAAIIGFTKQLAKDLAPFGITVNALAPGLVHADPTARIARKYLSLEPAAQKAMMSVIPAGRPGTGADVANAALFLASDESSYITGDTLVISGGI